MMNVILPPRLEQIVRNQVAAGQFQSESDVIAAAIQLLCQHSLIPANPPAKRRSPRGILADLHNDISLQDIKDIRREMWGGMDRDEIG